MSYSPVQTASLKERASLQKSMQVPWSHVYSKASRQPPSLSLFASFLEYRPGGPNKIEKL